MNRARPGNAGIMLLLFGIFALSSCTDAENGQLTAPEDSVLITGISIVEAAENRLSPPSDILIAGGKIQEIKAAGSIPKTHAKHIIPGAGRFAIPGLIDVHAHIGDGGIAEQTPMDRQKALTQFVRYGVTSIFVPGGGAGNDHDLQQWKSQCSTTALLCPALFGSGALITAHDSHPIRTIWNLPEDVDPEILYARGAVPVGDETNIDSLIESKAALGVDAIKIVIEDWGGEVPRLSDDQIDRLVDASHRRGLRVFAHVSMPAHVETGVQYGIDAVMHSVEAPLSASTLESMADQQIFFVSTLSLYDGFINRALGQRMPDAYALAGVSETALASLENFEFSPFQTKEQALSIQDIVNENLRRVAEAGVPLALGTDVNNPAVFPGYSSHEEMALMVEAGLTPAKALEAATLGSASFLNRSSTIGRIMPGYEADLILLDKNPLEDIKNTRTIQLVIQKGRIIDDVVSISGIPNTP